MLRNAITPLFNRSFVKGPTVTQSRHLWEWLNIIFNGIDNSRIDKVGPDVACAEWLLKNGGSVRWVGGDTLISDYNSLPTEKSSLKIEEIDASDSSITHHGFLHLKDCKFVKKIVLHKCSIMGDRAIPMLKYAESLRYLRISKCANITNAGLCNMPKLESLETLILSNLMSVKDINKCVTEINKIMPQCKINVE